MTTRISLLVFSLVMAFTPGRAAAQAKPVQAANPPAASAPSSAIPSPPASPALAPNAALEVDAAKLMKAAEVNIRRNDALARNYTFQNSVDEAWYDKHGKFQQRTSKREFVGVGQGMYERLIEWDGKPVSEEERARRERTLGGAAKPASIYCTYYDSSSGTSFQQTADCRRVFEDLPVFSNMRILGVESVQGRPAYVLEGTAAPTNPGQLQSAKVWIDVQDVIPVRWHFGYGPGRVHGMLGGSIIDASDEMEWQKINDEVWLPSRDFIEWHWKLPRFSLTRYLWGHGRDVRGEAKLVFANFRRFRVDTRIAQEASRPAPETSISREAPAARPSQPAEEAAIRSLVQRIIAAYQRKDSRSLFSFFSADSPNLFLKMKIESGWALHQTVERKNFTIREIDLQSQEARVRVSYLLSAASGTDESIEESSLTLELVREQDGWKLSDLFPDGLELAEELAAAESEKELDKLLSAEKPRVTQELVEVLVAHGNELMAMGQYEAAKSYFNTARRVADQLHDQEALAWALYGLGHGSLAQGQEGCSRRLFPEGHSDLRGGWRQEHLGGGIFLHRARLRRARHL